MTKNHIIDMDGIEVHGEVGYTWEDRTFSHEFGIRESGRWVSDSVIDLNAYMFNREGEIIDVALTPMQYAKAVDLLMQEEVDNERD